MPLSFVSRDYPGGPKWRADAHAPLRLLESTVGVWRALNASGLGVEGACLPAGYVLFWGLDLTGWSPTFVSNEYPHLLVVIDGWGARPDGAAIRRGQPLVFRLGSSSDYIDEAGEPWTLSEAEIISELADYLVFQEPGPDNQAYRRAVIEPLLAAVGLAERIPVVCAAAEAGVAELTRQSDASF